MSPFPPIVHVLAIAAGIFGALTFLPGLAPDLPGEDAFIRADAGTVSGPGDEDSFLQGGPLAVSSAATAARMRSRRASGVSTLAVALGRARAELASDQEVISLKVEPSTLDIDTDDSGGVALEDIVSSAPYLMVYAIGKAREDENGKTDVNDASALRSAEFRANSKAGVWTVHLDPSLPGPHTYMAVIPTGTVAFQVHVRPVAGS